MRLERTFYVDSHPCQGYRKPSYNGWDWGRLSTGSSKFRQLEPDGANGENKEQFLFYSSKTRFTPTTIASLAGFLGNMMIIYVRMVRYSKGRQQFFKLCLIRKGTERTGVVFESLIREHSGHLPQQFSFWSSTGIAR
jgi:hypothetical protein